MIDNSNVYVRHWVRFVGKRTGHTTVSRVRGIGHKCVYVNNPIHTDFKQVNQEDLIELVGSDQ